MSSIPSWLWLALGWTVIAAGAWTAILARGARASHGGRCCQKCGYNMAGIATLTCPECGRVAGSERELAKRLRRWPWRIGGLAAIICGWAVMQTPGVVAHGWAAAVPGPVLSLVAPVDLSGWAQANRSPSSPFTGWAGGSSSGSVSSIPVMPSGFATSPSTPPSTSTYSWFDQISDALFDDVWRRLDADAIGESSGTRYIRRVLEIKGEANEVTMPKAWAVGAPPPVPPTVKSVFRGGHSLSARANVTIVEQPADAMHVTILANAGTTRYTLATYDHPVDVSRPRQTLMRAVQSPEIDAAMADVLTPRLVVNGPSAWVEVNDRAATPRWQKVPLYARINLRLLVDGKEIGHTSFSIEPPNAPSAGRIAALVAWEDGGEEFARTMPAVMTFELAGDLMATADDYMNHWNSQQQTAAPDAWSGRFTVKPDMVRK